MTVFCVLNALLDKHVLIWNSEDTASWDSFKEERMKMRRRQQKEYKLLLLIDYKLISSFKLQILVTSYDFS